MPVFPVRKHGDRHAEGGVEDRKCEPDQKAHLRIAGTKLKLNGLKQNAHDLPIHVAGGKHSGKHTQDVPLVSRMGDDPIT
ncbi:MAG: hypothetical protein O3A63_10035 [Proteobacteria bacterium]|nr:hypothetical protein [Pseudomonadota bacterium]